VRLSLLVGRQKPIVDPSRPAERTVAASSGLSPAEIKQVLLSSSHVERARQVLRPRDAVDLPVTVTTIQYVDGQPDMVEVPYVDHIVAELIEPTLGAEDFIERIFLVQDRLGTDYPLLRGEVAEWYDFLATFFALNQKYMPSAVTFDRLHQEYQREHQGAGDEARAAQLAFLGKTLPFRLGTVPFKAIVDICESLKELDYPPGDERKGALSVCGEEVTPTVLCIDLESIHTPIDAVIHSSEKKGILESLFFAQAKDVAEEQRTALQALRSVVTANPLVMSLYYRLASAAVRYHGRVYTGGSTWQDYLLGTAELLSRIVSQCRALQGTVVDGKAFTALYDEVMSAKQKGSVGAFTTDSGRSAAASVQAEELTSTYTRQLAKLVTDLDLTSGDQETEALHKLDALYHDLVGAPGDLSTDVRAAVMASWTEIAARENLFALAGRAQQLRAHYLASTIPVDGLTSRSEWLYRTLLDAFNAYNEASHLYTRYLVRNPEPWIHELLCELYDGLGDMLMRFRPEFATMAQNADAFGVSAKRAADLRNPNVFYFKERDLLHEVGADPARRHIVEGKIKRTYEALAVDTTALRGIDGTTDVWSTTLRRLLAEVRVSGAGQFDIMEEVDGDFGAMALARELTPPEKAALSGLWTEEALKVGCFAVAGRLEHLRAGMLLDHLQQASGGDVPVSVEANKQLLRVFATLTDACNLFFRFSSRNQEPQVHECLCDLYTETGDLLSGYRQHFKAVIEDPETYGLALHQLTDLRNPLGFYLHAKERLAMMDVAGGERAAKLDEKLEEARRSL